jgi:hypothetical protein
METSASTEAFFMDKLECSQYVPRDITYLSEPNMDPSQAEQAGIPQHRVIEPPVLYFGTPVALIPR